MEKQWLEFLESDENHDNWWERKKALLIKRDAEVVRINGLGRIYQRLRYDDVDHFNYIIHLSLLIRQEDHFYQEEQVIPYQIKFVNDKIRRHDMIPRPIRNQYQKALSDELPRGHEGYRFEYDRLAAVQYAERWWNSYNPSFRTFDVDCTNYVSQCLYAGGAPMRGAPVRDQGWWYQGDNWSFSWAVAHSMRWYLSGSTQGLKGKEVETAEELSPGDIICYDFQGDGRWDHNTIVVAKDAYGMPLVNAHTDNSRHRYWSYEDSTAWTPNMKYKFFRIGE